MLRFTIWFFGSELLGIFNDYAFIFDIFIFLDKLITSVPLLITRLLSVFEYSAPDAKASIVQELFILLIDMLVPATRVMLSCFLLDRFETFVFKVTISLDKFETFVFKVAISVDRFETLVFKVPISVDRFEPKLNKVPISAERPFNDALNLYLKSA